MKKHPQLIAAKDLFHTMKAHRRWLHQVPEIGLILPQTREYVLNRLKNLGINPVLLSDSGIKAVIGKYSNTAILLRADMDALPIREETGLPFASINGNMHACGHDLHTAILLGVAELLVEAEKKDDLHGQVVLMFQPGEELLLGAKQMIDQGILENPAVEGAIALHVTPTPYNKEKLVYKNMPYTASDIFRITIGGDGSHGANPEMGVDVIAIASLLLSHFQTFQTRELSALDPVTITIGRFIADGAPNLLPKEAILEGSIRTIHRETRQAVKKRLAVLVEETANLFYAKGSIDYLSGAPPLINSQTLLSDLSPTIEVLFEEDEFIISNQVSMGAEDMAYMAEKIPTAYFILPAKLKNNHYPLHHSKVDFDEQVMIHGAAFLAQSAMDWLKKYV